MSKHQNSATSRQKSLNSQQQSGDRDALSYFLSDRYHLAASDDSKKASAIFIQFAQPLFEGEETSEEMEMLYSLALMGWNLSFLPAHVQVKMIADLVQTEKIELRIEFKANLAYLVNRKNQQFPEANWIIHDFHLESKTGGDELYIETSKVLTTKVATLEL